MRKQNVSFLVGYFPSFLLRVATRGFRESNQPSDLTQITRCIKYDDESSDLTINLMLMWYNLAF